MKILTLAAAAILTVAALTPAVAQPAPSTARTSRARTGGPGMNGLPGPGVTGGQSGAYVRVPSSRTPTDVGNMAFPDPSQTPAGNLPGVPVGR